MIGNIGNSYTHAVAVPGAWAKAGGCGGHGGADAVTLWPAFAGLASNTHNRTNVHDILGSALCRCILLKQQHSKCSS